MRVPRPALLSAASLPSGRVTRGSVACAPNHTHRSAHRVATPRRVEKPWGYEVIWAHTDRYLGKILHVNAGHALSLQYHERKDETIYLLRGELRFFAGTRDNLQQVT